jgi:NSS family neurotransmitter:Na+ symporter
MSNGETREQWGSRIGFIMAAAGSAVGLGNVWRFPYLVGMNGGAAFVVLYAALAVTIGLTVMLCEFCIGRAARTGSAGAFAKLSGNPFWRIFGWIGLAIGGFVILSYYGVIAGWTIKYMISSFTGLMPEALAGRSGDYYSDFIANKSSVVLFHLLAMAITTVIVAGGIGKGIERACKIMMPALFVIMLILIVRSVTLHGAGAGLSFYLMPDFSKLTWRSVLDALGQGFFSLSLGMGLRITYGSYIPKGERLPGNALMIFMLDTTAAFLAGLVIFPAVFAMGMAPDSGVGLTFITLPGVFAKMPAGSFFSFLFFLLLFFAALTSMMSLLEVAVTFFIDDLKMKRTPAALTAGSIVAVMGIPSAVSMSGTLNIFGMSFFDFMDYISNYIMMPITAIGVCLFLGWAWADAAKREITNDGLAPFGLSGLWIISARFLAPIAVGIILLNGNWHLLSQLFK